MNRPITKLVLSLMVGVLSLGTVSAEKPKIATVDMQKLFKEYHRTNTAQKRFNTEYARIQKGVNERLESIHRSRVILMTIGRQLENGSLSEEEKESKKQEAQLISQQLKLMQNEMRTFSNQEKQKVAKMKASSMKGIMDEILRKVIAHSKKQGFDFVFDKSGKNTNQVSFFPYLKDATDITANMLKELNKFAPGADKN